MEIEALPTLGRVPLAKIDAPMILAILRRMEARGVVEPVHKLKAHISQVLRYGIACGHIYSNPARDLAWALTPKMPKPRPALTNPRDIGRLMAAIERMRPGVKRGALKLLALTFVRSGELRAAEWTEVSLDAAEWRIPAARMKMRRAHIVPLSRQAVEALRELRALGRSERWLFRAFRRHTDRPMTGSVPRMALAALGYTGDRMCPHGFRAMAATLLSEQGWSSEVIERQLAHADRNSVRAVYQRSELLADRRRMMQAWADYLDLVCAQAILGR
jgi:integrase